MSKVKFAHLWVIREEDFKAPVVGRATLAYTLDAGNATAAVAFCNPNDEYKRKDGREKALARLELGQVLKMKRAPEKSTQSQKQLLTYVFEDLINDWNNADEVIAHYNMAIESNLQMPPNWVRSRGEYGTVLSFDINPNVQAFYRPERPPVEKKERKPFNREEWDLRMAEKEKRKAEKLALGKANVEKAKAEAKVMMDDLGWTELNAADAKARDEKADGPACCSLKH